MSDAYYREQSARRNRRLLLGAAILLVAACIGSGLYSVFWDTCTSSFEREPELVVASFIRAVANGDARTAAACWDHLAYLDIESGCSEICLSRLWGTPYTLGEVQLSQPTFESGRARIQARAEISCPDGEQHTAEITLDSVGANAPWRHWKIIRSDFGGPLAEPWCQ